MISVGGVAFSVLLIMSIQGLYQGWSNKIGEYIRTVPADYWITQTGATDMRDGLQRKQGRHYRQPRPAPAHRR